MLSVDILPARNALIPLFALDDLYFKGDAARLRKAFLWLLCAIRGGRYSSAATTTIAQDLTAIRNAADTESAIAALYAPLEANLDFTPEQLLRRYDEEPFLRLMLYLVAFNAGAEDWKTGQRLGFDRSDNCLNEGFRPEWHHFVPRGRLQRRQPPPPEELSNCLSNIVVLSEGDNRRFSYSEPYKYLEKYQVPAASVHQQFFPPRELWCAERFEEFAQARSQILATAMNAYVAGLQQGG